ncbi:MAG: hypothetical protein K6F73_07050 [Lachnospiraceae bacterium]|nr:hypothetical protein [Lachnospiraceae bacterium]
MNKITREVKLSQKYALEKDKHGLIKLTKENVAHVEAMIRYNSSYRKAFDKNAEDSSAHHFVSLKAVLIEKKKVSDTEYREIVHNVVRALDRENSTHLKADGDGINTITDRICGIKRQADLVRYLKDPKGTNYKLLRILETKTEPTGESQKGNKRVGRRNPSFASKFCHYACYYLFEGEKEQDNYSIYDSVIKKALPRYMEAYGVAKQDLTDYYTYQKVIDEIISKSKSGISRNGFDHLIWYCYKGGVTVEEDDK